MGKYIQYLNITYFGKESGKESEKITHTHITELFCYILETILINYTSIFKNFRKKSK